MANITAFGGSSNVPAFVRTATGNLADLKVSVGYPVVSIKGKVFTFKDGDESKLITEPGKDTPAPFLEVVILDVGPSTDMKFNSRVFYMAKYVEGSAAKPDCLSEDGITPHADSLEPQSKSCQLCPHNVKGSGDTGKGKACRSSKRLAIATPDALDKPMMLRVPGDSLMAFSDYLVWMKKSGVQDTAHIITKIGFDYTVSHPNLTFKALGWATSDPAEAKAAEIVQYITGRKELPHTEQAIEEPFEQPAPAFVTEAKAEKAKVEKAKPAPKPAAVEDDDLPTTPKATVKVEEAKKPAPAAEVVEESDAALDAALDDLDFDD